MWKSSIFLSINLFLLLLLIFSLSFYMIETQVTLMMFSCMYNLFVIHQIKIKIISRRGKSINIYNDRNWVTVISGQNIWEEKTSCMESLIHIITVGCHRHGTCVWNNMIMIMLTIKSKKIKEEEEVLYFIHSFTCLNCHQDITFPC